MTSLIPALLSFSHSFILMTNYLHITEHNVTDNTPIRHRQNTEQIKHGLDPRPGFRVNISALIILITIHIATSHIHFSPLLHCILRLLLDITENSRSTTRTLTYRQHGYNVSISTFHRRTPKIHPVSILAPSPLHEQYAQPCHSPSHVSLSPFTLSPNCTSKKMPSYTSRTFPARYIDDV